jgi:ribosomal-protein-alanine N-acetyltransferase
MNALRADAAWPPAPDQLVVRIIAMRRRHLRAVGRIEGQVYPRPWTHATFLSELGQRDDRCYLVAKVGNNVVGYAGELFALDDAHVTTIAVDPAWHRHQIGTRLLLALAHQAITRGSTSLTLEVRVSNKPAQEMYRRFGFAPAGIRQRYYENVEDAIVMWAHDITGADYRERLDLLEGTVRGRTIMDRLP